MLTTKSGASRFHDGSRNRLLSWKMGASRRSSNVSFELSVVEDGDRRWVLGESTAGNLGEQVEVRGRERIDGHLLLVTFAKRYR